MLRQSFGSSQSSRKFKIGNQNNTSFLPRKDTFQRQSTVFSPQPRIGTLEESNFRPKFQKQNSIRPANQKSSIRQVKLLSFNTMIQESSQKKKAYPEKGDLGSIREADSPNLELISEDESSSAPSQHKASKPKIIMNHLNNDGTITMFKNKEKPKLLPKEKIAPIRPFSISPVVKRPIVIPSIKEKLSKQSREKSDNIPSTRAGVFSNSKNSRNKTLEVPSSTRLKTAKDSSTLVNNTFRTKDSSNIHQTSISNTNTTRNQAQNKGDVSHRWFSPPSVSSSKTKKSKIDYQGKLHDIYFEEKQEKEANNEWYTKVFESQLDNENHRIHHLYKICDILKDVESTDPILLPKMYRYKVLERMNYKQEIQDLIKRFNEDQFDYDSEVMKFGAQHRKMIDVIWNIKKKYFSQQLPY